MVLLNILYGLILSFFLMIGYAGATGSMDFNERGFVALWAMWTVGHIVYDAVAYQVVKFFNKTKDDGVYRG